MRLCLKSPKSAILLHICSCLCDHPWHYYKVQCEILYIALVNVISVNIHSSSLLCSYCLSFQISLFVFITKYSDTVFLIWEQGHVLQLRHFEQKFCSHDNGTFMISKRNANVWYFDSSRPIEIMLFDNLVMTFFAGYSIYINKLYYTISRNQSCIL